MCPMLHMWLNGLTNKPNQAWRHITLYHSTSSEMTMSAVSSKGASLCILFFCVMVTLYFLQRHLSTSFLNLALLFLSLTHAHSYHSPSNNCSWIPTTIFIMCNTFSLLVSNVSTRNNQCRLRPWFIIQILEVPGLIVRNDSPLVSTRCQTAHGNFESHWNL
jgi:hypothetical protein